MVSPSPGAAREEVEVPPKQAELMGRVADLEALYNEALNYGLLHPDGDRNPNPDLSDGKWRGTVLRHAALEWRGEPGVMYGGVWFNFLGIKHSSAAG